jgi:hypothetical protein
MPSVPKRQQNMRGLVVESDAYGFSLAGDLVNRLAFNELCADLWQGRHSSNGQKPIRSCEQKNVT